MENYSIYIACKIHILIVDVFLQNKQVKPLYYKKITHFVELT